MAEHIDKGLEFVRDNALDGAVIDSDLQGDGSSPLCEQLRKRDIPFMMLQEAGRRSRARSALAGLARPAVGREPRQPDARASARRPTGQALQPHLEQVSPDEPARR